MIFLSFYFVSYKGETLSLSTPHLSMSLATELVVSIYYNNLYLIYFGLPGLGDWAHSVAMLLTTNNFLYSVREFDNWLVQHNQTKHQISPLTNYKNLHRKPHTKY